MNLVAAGISWSVGDARIVHDVSLRCAPGSLVGLIGPNGSGKSSLLRCLYRVLQPQAGTVTLDGHDVWRLTVRETSRRVAVVLQERLSAVDFRVREVVLMGRSPHKRTFESDTADDQRIVDDALARVGLGACGDRTFATLSGGEQQRVLIARAIAQQPRMLVLDEPTSHLDIFHQFRVLDLVRALGVTTIAALHDLNLAATYCDFLYVLKAGALVASGTPNAVLTPDLVREVYGVDAEIMRHPLTDRVHVIFLRPEQGSPSGAVPK